MIRTRNFILYMLSLVVLLMAVTLSIHTAPRPTPPPPIAFSTSTPPSTTATAPPDTTNRTANLDKMLAAIKASPEKITPHPSVPSTIVVGSTSTTPTQTNANVTLQRCPFPDDALPFVPQWPVTDVAIANREGARLVYTSQVVQSAGSSTANSVVKPLLQLPINPTKLHSPHCVPSEVIGVTTRGTLIFNGDVAPYLDTNPNTLIGYARDGYPIYGVYNGPTDACGGYEGPDGYRYAISKHRKFILGCFAATPHNFTL